MAQKIHPLKQLIRDAILADKAISAEKIKQLRAISENAITRLKRVFWLAIIIFNLMVWYPFSAPIPPILRLTVAIVAILVAIIFPILGIRRHRVYLHLLEDCSEGPKRRNTDDSGRKYIDQVKKQGRFFVNAEFLMLEEQKP